MLSGLAAAANDRLRVARRPVVVRSDDADVVRCVPHMEMLSNLLLVEEGVVATAHSLFSPVSRLCEVVLDANTALPVLAVLQANCRKLDPMKQWVFESLGFAPLQNQKDRTC